VLCHFLPMWSSRSALRRCWDDIFVTEYLAFRWIGGRRAWSMPSASFSATPSRIPSTSASFLCLTGTLPGSS
jgi:hypothetical protein